MGDPVVAVPTSPPSRLSWYVMPPEGSLDAPNVKDATALRGVDPTSAKLDGVDGPLLSTATITPVLGELTLPRLSTALTVYV